MGSTVGRLAFSALAAWAAVASAAELSKLVKAQVVVVGGASIFRHEVAVSNKGEPRRVSSVLLWNNPGLADRPKELSAPDGWEVQAVSREVANGTTWAVEFRCRSVQSSGNSNGKSTQEPSDEEVPCGIRAGETVKFFIVLPYPSESLEKQPILVGFSDGRVGIAS